MNVIYIFKALGTKVVTRSVVTYEYRHRHRHQSERAELQLASSTALGTQSQYCPLRDANHVGGKENLEVPLPTAASPSPILPSKDPISYSNGLTSYPSFLEEGVHSHGNV